MSLTPRTRLADRAGCKTLGGTWGSAWGLAWPPGGKEIWFTAAKSGWHRELRAFSLSGKERLVARGLTTMTLYDIARNGRVLLAHDNLRFGTLAPPPGGPSWCSNGSSRTGSTTLASRRRLRRIAHRDLEDELQRVRTDERAERGGQDRA